MRTMRRANAIRPTTVNTPATAPLLFQNPPLELELLLAVAAALLPDALTVVGVIGTTVVTVAIPPTPSVVVMISLVDELLELVVTGIAVVTSVGVDVVPVFDVVDGVVAVVNAVVLVVVPGVVLVVPVVDVDKVVSVKAVVDEDVVSVSVDDDVVEVCVKVVVSVGDEVVPVPGSDTLVLVVDSDILFFKAFSVHTKSQGKTLVGNANRMRMKRGVNKGSDIELGSRSLFMAGSWSESFFSWPSFAGRGSGGEAVTRSKVR